MLKPYIQKVINRQDLTAEELEECVDVATIGRYAGDIDVVES